MVRAMAKEAEANRERIAAMIRAEGEMMAAQKLVEAAEILKQNKLAIELRQLQTLERISKESKTDTFVIPDSIFENKDSLMATVMAGNVIKNDTNLMDFNNHDSFDRDDDDTSYDPISDNTKLFKF